MKKILKYATVAAAIGIGVASYALKKQHDEQAVGKLALENAKGMIPSGEKITGSWLMVHPTWSAEENQFFYEGGITTDKTTYDFTAEMTGNIITFVNQIR